MSASILLGCLCWIVSIMLDNIDSDKRLFYKIDSPIPVTQKSVIEWKQTYLITCELVDSINRCFGPSLLILVSTCFVRMVNHLFGFIASFRQDLKEPINVIFAIHGLLILLFVFGHYCAITFVGYRMRRQVKKRPSVF